jgi:hypothetical protein
VRAGVIELSSNQSMKPTQHFVVSFRSMHTVGFQSAGWLISVSFGAEATRGFFLHLN